MKEACDQGEGHEGAEEEAHESEPSSKVLSQWIHQLEEEASNQYAVDYSRD